MKWYQWMIIVLLQTGLVALGLWAYHCFLGGTGLEPGLAITIWAAVITIVFVVFSLLGVKNIDGKIKDLEDSNRKIVEKYEAIESKSSELIRSLEYSRKKIVEEAENEIKKITNNSRQIQNYYQHLMMIESEMNPERRIVMYTDLLAKPAPPEGIDKGYLYLKRGGNYMMLGQLEKAKADLDLGLDLCAEINKSAAYSQIADYYVRKGDFLKSVEYFRKAIEASPSSLLYSDLGNSLNKTKAFDEADACYDKALAINPELGGVYYNKALRMKETIEQPTSADYAQMLSYIEKSLSINPTFLPAYINKAAVLREQGMEAEASEVLTQALMLMTNDDVVLGIMQRGIAYRMMNNLPQALNDFRTVLFHRPHLVQNICNLALTHLGMGYLREAGYYAQLGLDEANKQNDHLCDGDLYQVQQTVLALQRAPFSIPKTPQKPQQ